MGMFQASPNDDISQLPNVVARDTTGSGTSTLIRQARAGDREAFTRLFQCYNSQICTYLGRLVGNSEAGRDLAQETFFQAWKRLSTLRDDSSFQPWLYRIATNLAKSYLQHEKRIFRLPWEEQKGYGAEMASEWLYVAGPEERMPESQCVLLALARVSPQNRICLLLQLVAGFSQREIATLLGIREKSVSAYVSRGKEQFRLAYQDQKGDERV